ncbi:MAG: glycosyltransferase [Clostridium sp.]|jgi:glycosyltransferase involved in cell wall biosynthesis|nr:glycosyltransferase [Clostridium sp.]
MIPISICMIVKNEREHLEECLKRLRPYDWEIVVVDTGSTDETRAIALRYADKVADFAWCDDFSAARNFSIELADRPYILVLDADEYLVRVDMDELLGAIKVHPKDLGQILIANHFYSNQTESTSEERFPRFFAKQFYRYRYPIHEQVVSKAPNAAQPIFYDIPVYLEHYGYLLTREAYVAKAQRNNKLLFEWLKKDPKNPYVFFQIGQSYHAIDEEENAYPYFREAFELSRGRHAQYEKSLIPSYAAVLLSTNRMEEANDLLAFIQSTDYQDNADLCCTCGLIYIKQKRLLLAMGEFVRALYAPIHTNHDATHNIPLYNLGFINEKLGDPKEALANYRMCHDFPLATKRIAFLEKL